jgi:S1-C subfamily serine protease
VAGGFKPPEIIVYGTGFWIKDKKVFVTCAHVVQHILGAPIELAGMLVVGGNGVDYKKATITSIDFIHDIAVLNIEADENYILNQSLNGLEISNEEIEVGEAVAYAGFPLGNQLLNQKHSPTYAEGVIGQEILGTNGPKWIQISGPVVGGYSGGPIILKESKKVIGMVSNSPSKEAGDASIFRSVHWRHLKSISDLVES